MKRQLISNEPHGGAVANQKSFAIIFDDGDEVMAGLKKLAAEEHLAASHFTAIGAFKEVTLGYFDWQKKDYIKIPVQEQVEVLSLLGDVTLNEGKPNIHAHVVLGKRDGSTTGGHRIEARVRPTLEVILTESPKHLTRRFDKESGLALICLRDGNND
jgi:predicted DNA-binding protein with PD1-like motif